MPVKIEGLEALALYLKSAPEQIGKVKEVVQKDGSQLQKQTVSNMNDAYIHGYSTGKTKRMTTLELSNGGMTATVAPGTDYFPYLEFGTRKMEAMPTLHPAFFEISQIFQKDIEDVFKK